MTDRPYFAKSSHCTIYTTTTHQSQARWHELCRGYLSSKYQRRVNSGISFIAGLTLTLYCNCCYTYIMYYVSTNYYFSEHALMLNASSPELRSGSYSPASSRFTEQKMPDTLQTTPVIRMHTSVRRSLSERRSPCSLRWHAHGSMRVMAAPVTLPVKPISSENLGTKRARKYDDISRAARTSRAGRETCRPSASAEKAESVLRSSNITGYDKHCNLK